jgi:ferredoxin-NADP reductase
MLLTLPIREVLPATPRARIVRIDLAGHRFEFAAGQAVLVARAGQPRRRPYSIAAAPEDARRDGWIELLIGVDERGRPTADLTLEPRARLDVEGPRGAFVFPEHPAERRFTFIAGGTGIAPLRAMLRHALAIPHREIGLFYSARTASEFAYEAEFRQLAETGRLELRQTVTRGVDETWAGARGRFGRRDLQGLVHDPATLCFVCGPVAFVEEMSLLLLEIGVEPPRIRVEEWKRA